MEVANSKSSNSFLQKNCPSFLYFRILKQQQQQQQQLLQQQQQQQLQQQQRSRNNNNSYCSNNSNNNNNSYCSNNDTTTATVATATSERLFVFNHWLKLRTWRHWLAVVDAFKSNSFHCLALIRHRHFFASQKWQQLSNFFAILKCWVRILSQINVGLFADAELKPEPDLMKKIQRRNGIRLKLTNQKSSYWSRDWFDWSISAWCLILR